MQVEDGWSQAVDLTSQYLKTKRRADYLFESITGHIHSNERHRCQNLFYGVIRNIALIEWAIKQNVRRMPKGRLKALLLIAGYELVEAIEQGRGREPPVVHHAVERGKNLLSPSEVRLANAVLRRLPDALRDGPPVQSADAGELALRHSHPKWLVSRWIGAFGLSNTAKLLEWNQAPAPYYIRVFGDVPESASAFLEPTRWPRFHRVGSGGWDCAKRLMEKGLAYAQDPSTRLAPEILGPLPGEAVLDLCAAPGGKSLLLADLIRDPGILVSLEKPGGRLDLLRENLSRYPWCRASVVGADLLAVSPSMMEARGLPGLYDAVLLDVPCSNTGVFRRRVDARWGITPENLVAVTELQGRLLRAAANLVRPSGRLVYSTCSIEPAENREIVEHFAAARGGEFALEHAREHYPWVTGHDGGGVFLLRRRPE